MKSNLKEKIKFSGIVLLVFILSVISFQWRGIYFYLVPTQRAKAIIKKQSNIVTVPGKIVFNSSRDWKSKGQAIHLLSGGQIEKNGTGLCPRFIPNTNSMIFLNSGVHIYNLSTKEVEDLKVQADISSVSGYDVSPDGRQIVFVETTQGKKNGSIIRVENLYIINTDGMSNPKQITFFNGANFFGGPRWSPDGKQILFHKDDSERAKKINWGNREQQAPSLFVINSDGTGLKNLLQSTNYFGWHGSWSHDGKKIAFIVLSDDIGLNEIAIFDIAVEKVLQITKAPSIKELETNKNVKEELQEKVKKGYPLYKDHPLFSPDDTQVAFIGRCRGGYFSGSELFVVNAKGGEIQRLTAPHWTRMGWASIESFDWAD